MPRLEQPSRMALGTLSLRRQNLDVTLLCCSKKAEALAALLAPLWLCSFAICQAAEEEHQAGKHA